uniref:G2E3 ligase n=1 Tax=Strix occidentalis caurina TaxID=311401 RepID=A0A8D0FYU2_STROC
QPHPAPCPEKCFVCGDSGAAITCCWEGCNCSFHLPCAMEGECITQYFYPSFCREHRPEQEVEAAPDKNTECLICLEPVEDRKSYHTMVCPACKHAWFHRGCIQVGAVPSCPRHGRDKHDFLVDMLTMGIRIPLRLVSFEPLIQRHSRCDARVCLCPRGREQAEERGPWELLLCSSCAAEGTHRRCSNLGTSRTSWECETSESSCPSPAPESGSRSRCRGPVRMRDRSRVERRAQNPYSRRGRRRGSSRALSPRSGPDPPPPAQ